MSEAGIEGYHATRLAHDERRTVLWRTLVESHFARLIPADGCVLELGCGHCDFINHVRARRRGASPAGVVTWVVGGALLLTAVGLGYAALRPTVVQHEGVDAGIGSCFADAGAGVQVVSCADDYDYRAVDRVDSLGECPSGTERTVRSGRDHLCLVYDAGE